MLDRKTISFKPAFQWVLTGLLWLIIILPGNPVHAEETVKDSAYYKLQINTMQRHKVSGNDSIFPLAEQLIRDISGHPEFNYVLPQIEMTLGNYYYRKKEFGQAITIYQNLLDSSIQRNDTVFQIHAQESLGNVYQYLGEHQKSVDNFTKGYLFWKERKEDKRMARSARNMAESLVEMERYDEALALIDTAIKAYLRYPDEFWTPISYYHRGDLLLEKAQINGLSEELKRDIEQTISTGMSHVTQTMKNTDVEGYLTLLQARLAALQNDFNETIKKGEEAFKLLEPASLSSKSELPLLTHLLAEAYDSIGDYSKAINYLDKYALYNDSLNLMNQDKLARGHDIKLKYKNKKADEEMRILAKLEDEKVKHNAYLARQKMYYLIGAVFFVPLLILLFIILKRRAKLKWFYRQLEQRNNELIDSINYAEKIQRSMLPLEEDLKQSFKEHFVLFKPKHIVAGDFYWFATHQQYTYLAAADCTGHGVPGALVSLVCHEALQRALLEFNLLSTNAILDKTRELVKERLNHTNSNLKDGMDIALCRIDNTNLKVQFSGAHNPLWLIRNHELISYRGDRQPVGASYVEEPFTAEETVLQKGDQFYIFSDGYADQFGGDTGKKYKASNLKKAIVSVSDQKLPEQGQFLDSNFEQWKNNYEQIDDVCIIGFKVT
ncbi:MAG: SpoIIE family protein phosphatase [Flavobacteriales bacterium]|nr:SpoIIE family protein phosphatase [Flavobacteriales bacterium]